MIYSKSSFFFEKTLPIDTIKNPPKAHLPTSSQAGRGADPEQLKTLDQCSAAGQLAGTPSPVWGIQGAKSERKSFALSPTARA